MNGFKIERKQLSRFGVTSFFILEGIMMGTWSSGLPDIQDNLDLDDGELGTAALFVSLGMTLATFFAAISVRNYGSKYSTMIAGLLLCCSLPGISLSNSFPLLIFTMFIFGFTMGIMDVSMNASGITTEIVYKQTTEIVYKQGIYCTFHGSYSFAMALGSFLGGALTSLSFSMLYIFISVSSVLFMLSLLAGHNLYSKGEEEEIISLDSNKLTEKSTNVTFFSSPSSYYLCCIGFLAVFGESNMVTWCIVFLVRYINDSPIVSSIGLSVFMIFMGLGRFNSDRLRAIFGLRVMVFYAGIFATVGGLLIFLSPWFDFSTNNALSISIAFLGIALMGIGLSTLVPNIFVTAGRIPGVEAGSAIAQLSIFVNLGSVSGPAIIGFASSIMSSLQYAILINAILISSITFCSFGLSSLEKANPANSIVSYSDSFEEHNPLVDPLIIKTNER